MNAIIQYKYHYYLKWYMSLTELEKLTTTGMWIRDRCIIFHSLMLGIEAEVPPTYGPFDHLPICLS